MTHDRGREPVRTCIGCRRRAPSHELVRVRHDGDGRLDVGAGDGRGAWLCAPPAGLHCFDTAVERGALARSLRAGIAPDELVRVRARIAGRTGI